jgi:hypothetical protein
MGYRDGGVVITKDRHLSSKEEHLGSIRLFPRLIKMKAYFRDTLELSINVAGKGGSCMRFAVWSASGSDCLARELGTDLSERVIVILTEKAGPIIVPVGSLWRITNSLRWVSAHMQNKFISLNKI